MVALHHPILVVNSAFQMLLDAHKPRSFSSKIASNSSLSSSCVLHSPNKVFHSPVHDLSFTLLDFTMDLHKCIEQYFLSTPPSKWDIPTLAKEASQVHPKPSKGAFVGTLRDRLESTLKSPLLKKSAKEKAQALLNSLSKVKLHRQH